MIRVAFQGLPGDCQPQAMINHFKREVGRFMSAQ